MSHPVHLIYLAKPKYGGWPTFTGHLMHGLKALGYSPYLWKAGKRTEKSPRTWGRGMSYFNASREYLVELARSGTAVVTAVEPEHADTLDYLLRAGASVVIHDPTELKGDTPSAVARSRHPVVCIRKAAAAHVPAANIVIPHPYMPSKAPLRTPRRKYNAVAYSRLDFDKHTGLIVKANQQLAPNKRVHIYGAENRTYTHFKLEDLDPEWRTHYQGQIPGQSLWAGAHLARQATWAVDLSAIKGDGGGTQYTFLEALDARAHLVINTNWLTGDPDMDTIAPTATAVSSHTQLAALIGDVPPAYPEKETAALLAHHHAAECAKKLLATRSAR